MSPPHPRARKRKLLPHAGHEFGLWRCDVSWEGGLSHDSQRSPVASPRADCPPTACPPVTASRGLPTFPFVMRRDGGPELVIRGEHPWLVSSRQAMPVLPRRRHEIGQPVQEVKRREFDDAVGTRACGLPPAPRAHPVGRLVSGEHVADAGDAAVFAADHGEPFQREGRPGTVSQQVLEGRCRGMWLLRWPCEGLPGRVRPRRGSCDADSATPRATPSKKDEPGMARTKRAEMAHRWCDSPPLSGRGAAAESRGDRRTATQNPRRVVRCRSRP